MPYRNSSLTLVSLAAGLDAAMLLLFVVIGRASHGEGLWGVLGTWWPFLAGLVVAWLVVTARRAPLQIVWTGVGVWLITVVVAMLLRVVSGQGVQLSFVIVTFLVLGVLLLGWRAIALLVQRRRRRRASVQGSRVAG
ncbi:DUF3054 domain-containing protein [Cryobacterium zongtaii]|uniref:DUF3054 domain-containing protein n=1 Tax=Cryobacterium zongtaii TaxID=1259217 RepID=A0A2S3Z6F4_9MICO|nr:DUF3054 domain-containing protein [Cryobacterium zongtaii]POH60423.1 DUF3054 domain-containing protein [Cryobacterium zongtaii]